MDWKIFSQELGKRLKSVRKIAGFTQQQIAKEIGLSRQYIIQIEKGKAENVSLNVILDYLNACEVKFADFFNELEKFISKKQYDQIVSAIDFPKNNKLRKKVDRDIAFYHTKIQGKKGKAKPLSFQAQHKAVVKFGIYRSKIELIESIAYKIIADSVPNTILNPFYRGFVRQIYKTLKKNHSLHLALDRGFDDIIKRWVKRGLEEDVLVKLKDTIITHFKTEPIEIS